VRVDIDDRLSHSIERVARQQALQRVAAAAAVGLVQFPHVRHVVTDLALRRQHETIRRVHELSTVGDAFDEDLQ